MLKLVFYNHDTSLKVRPALAHDDFSNSCKWQDTLEFILVENSNFTMVWTSLLPDLDPLYAESLIALISARFPISPLHKKLKQDCPEFVFNSASDELVFFGGSFNPWHKGHQSCLDLLSPEKVCLIVPDKSPFKELRDQHAVTSVLQLSSHAKIHKNQYIVPTFLLRDEKNPTVNWVEKLKLDYPNQKISLLMGFDTFSSLTKWTRASDLLPLIHTLYVVSRLEEDDERSKVLTQVQAYAPNLQAVFLGRHQYENLSSTAIRNQKL